MTTERPTDEVLANVLIRADLAEQEGERNIEVSLDGIRALVAEVRASRAERRAPVAAPPLPPEVREILRDAAWGVIGVCVRERAAAAIVAHDLCPRCAGTGMELLDAGPGGPAAWGTCHGCDPVPAAHAAETQKSCRHGPYTYVQGCPGCERVELRRPATKEGYGHATDTTPPGDGGPPIQGVAGGRAEEDRGGRSGSAVFEPSVREQRSAPAPQGPQAEAAEVARGAATAATGDALASCDWEGSR